MPFGLQPLDLIVIVVVALVIFGPKRLPQLGRWLGKTFSSFRKGARDLADGFTEETRAQDASGTAGNAAGSGAGAAAPGATGEQAAEPTPGSNAGPTADTAAGPAAHPTGGIFCTACGAANSADARFCNKCGTRLTV
jgi:sec-independent protein translocase protein TatA